MTVSLDRREWRCRIMIPRPTSSPNSGMVQSGSTAKMSPRATPAKAEWLIASEKKAMRKLTTRMPITAVMGASRSSPTMACCMKRTCMHSNGRIWATRA